MGTCFSVIDAALNGDTDRVRRRLNWGARVNARRRTGGTALGYAAEYGRTEIVRLLLDRGAKVDVKDKYSGATYLSQAAFFGRTEIVRMLLDKGAKVDAKDNHGETALMKAARQGHTDTARLLLDRGANVDAKSNDGETALMRAAYEHTDTARMLLDRGANMDAKSNRGTALAYCHYNVSLTSLLLTRGALIDATNVSVVEDLIDKLGKSDEVYALVKGYLDKDEELVNAFLQCACRCVRSQLRWNGTDDTARFTTLVKFGVVTIDRADQLIRFAMWDDDNPLTLAAANKNIQLVKYLLDNGENINHENKFGQTAFSFAESNNDKSLIELLHSRGAAVREQRQSDYPTWGMALADLDAFVKAAGGKLIGKTTYQVQAVVKEMTADKMLSYCECMGMTDPANVFISHAWAYLFLDLVEAIRSHLGGDPNAILWIDVLSVNQHPVTTVKLPFSFWSTVFKGAIIRIGRVLLILHPWENPAPLLRAWCIFESYCAISGGCKFEVALGKEDKIGFKVALSRNNKLLDELVGQIDVMKSTAQEKEDLRLILKSIQKYQGGADKINNELRERVRAGYSATDDAAGVKLRI